MQTSDPSVEDTTPPLPPPEDVRLTHKENQNNHHHVAEITTAVVTEEPGPSVPAPVVRTEVAVPSRFAGKPKDEVAAIKIQTAFRGYLVCVVIFLPFSCLFGAKFNEFFFVFMFSLNVFYI